MSQPSFHWKLRSLVALCFESVDVRVAARVTRVTTRSEFPQFTMIVAPINPRAAKVARIRVR